MILSRVWYVLLGLAVSVALYVVFVAVGQFDRRGMLALKEGLASDSQTVEWALKIDARRRMDALLAGSVDPKLQGALVAAAAAKEKLPDNAKADARKALGTIQEAIPADYRSDAVFAIDRDGRVVAEVGFEAVAGNEDFELGGYPAVNDALHGWLRDDIWVLGAKMYAVAARPVEYDVTQRPPGAIVGIREVNAKFASDLAKRTRTSIAFYAQGEKVAGATGADGFDAEKLDAVGNDLKNVDDKSYGDSGRTDPKMLNDELGVMYARLAGEAWNFGGGFAVARTRHALGGPLGFLTSADDKDKANVPWILLGAVALVAAGLGIVFTLLEHTSPLNELVRQAERLQAGGIDGLQVAAFRGSYRLVAQNLNLGMERSIEKAGGVTRKPADLESILGPTPAQPAMSAFSFPQAGGGDDGVVPPVPPAVGSGPALPPARLSPEPGPRPAAGGPARPTPPGPAVPPGPSSPALPAAGMPSSPGLAAPPPTPAAGRPPPPRNSPVGPPPPVRPPPAAAPPAPSPSGSSPVGGEEDDDATMVGAVPPDILAQATGGGVESSGEQAEWLNVFDDFVRTKKQCGEPTDGLTFEKFAQTLKKNRDALVQRHACKRVRFTVYVKDGRASLKATPVKE
jgi:hypothetical protein